MSAVAERSWVSRVEDGECKKHLFLAIPMDNPVLYNFGHIEAYCVYCDLYYASVEESYSKARVERSTKRFGHDWQPNPKDPDGHVCTRCGLLEHTDIHQYDAYDDWYSQRFKTKNGRKASGHDMLLICPKAPEKIKSLKNWRRISKRKRGGGTGPAVGR